ncbi:glycoside hydrolase family 2 TIM barrel-domain containing protein [Ruania halotolerans]|uniref:glycoside hydrolase family 2 TIM barrel-domain containing protein n=1 Tax=Ruania halotolerans TaxID=2897773 RepID=UPI001E2C444F|nr:glycoside hydrolase family 2 TIM barrel-domain containing protein [Ruania halotolerans]UFU06133.1 DUF4982 domain-containing protein [Ruania halotolerans]
MRTGDTRQRESLDHGWRFHLGDAPGAEREDYDDTRWRTLDLPHDWSIEGSYAEDNPSGREGAFLPTGIGWYRREVDLPDLASGARAVVEFDGVYRCSDAWINGAHLGHRPSGNIGFAYDLTSALRPGRNVLAVRVDHSQAPSARWYTGSGIYRHVWLTVTDEVHIDHWGVQITTPAVTAESAAIAVRTRIQNMSALARDAVGSFEVMDADGTVYAHGQADVSLPPEGEAMLEVDLALPSPRLWSPDHPELYLLRITLEERGRAVDLVDTTFGVRSIRFDPTDGFFLNGKPMTLRGVCHHRDGGPVGAAVPEPVLLRRLRMLKDMGCNAIRVGHSPAAPEFYDLCDRLGFLVIDEAFDGWATPKARYDYGLSFAQWWQRDLADLIARDRNHPSVIMWSIGNEVPDKTDKQAQELVDVVHELDPTRPVTCGRGISGIEDVQGFNGQGGVPGVLEAYHEEFPDRVLLLTEEPHTLQTRGFYRTRTWWRDRNRPRQEVPNLTEKELFTDGSVLYNSSYDNSGVRCCARHSWRRTRALPYLCGEFRWTGFDYLGESPRWPARTYNYGVIDLCGFPKDHFYFYQSQWTREPMVHVLPHWTHPGLEGVEIPVWVYTNCDAVELFLDDESLGVKHVGDDLHMEWRVPYSPGTLRAVARRDARDRAVTAVTTAATPAALRLSSDNTDLAADGCDISHVVFAVVDRAGVQVPQAGHTVWFSWSGPIRCLGFDNGDPLDLTAHQASQRRVFNGLGLGIFSSTQEAGDIEIIAGAVLGDQYFGDVTDVSVVIEGIDLRGGTAPDLSAYDIRYTTDGSEPSKLAARYQGPIRLDRSCVVRAVVVGEDRPVLSMEQEFIRGERPQVVDMTHGNESPADLTVAPGPHDQQAVGTWRSPHQEISLRDDGTVGRPQAYGSKSELVGSWWYDFPHDRFEDLDDAGTGEIRWIDGSTSELHLTDQGADHLDIVIANTEVRFRRISSQPTARAPEGGADT